MANPLVAVSDSVFPNLDPARAVLAKIGAELRLASDYDTRSYHAGGAAKPMRCSSPTLKLRLT